MCMKPYKMHDVLLTVQHSSIGTDSSTSFISTSRDVLIIKSISRLAAGKAKSLILLIGI